MMYKVKFIIQIHSGMSALSSDDVWVCRSLELPFPPTKDIEINFGDDDIGQDDPRQIVWCPEDNMFKVYSENKELYDHIIANHFKHDREYMEKRFEEIVAEYLNSGWERDTEL